MWEDLLKRARAKLGPDHRDTLAAMANLGINYRDAGRLPEGTNLLEQTWAKARKQPNPVVNDLAWIRKELADAYDRAGRFANSEPLYREALNAAHKRHKEASTDSTALQASLALSLLEQQKYAEAEPLLRECLKFREQNEPDHWATFNAKSMLGGSLLGQKKYADAEPLLLAGYEGMKQREGKIYPPVRGARMSKAIERLVQLYDEWGKPEKAAEWRAKLPPAIAELPADVFARP